MNLRHPAFVARLTPASGTSDPGTLLGEMKYTGYRIGQGVPNTTAVDDRPPRWRSVFPSYTHLRALTQS